MQEFWKLHKSGVQRTGLAAGGIFYNVRPGTAAQIWLDYEVKN